MNKNKVAAAVEGAMLLFSLIYSVRCFFIKQYSQLLQPALVIALIILTELLIKAFKSCGSQRLRIPALLFIIMTKMLGNMLGFYTLIQHWDKLEHFLSGILCAFIGLVLFERLYDVRTWEFNSIRLKCWFLFFFAGAVAGWWEIFEFSMDSWLKLNCQGGISDTMWDMIMGTLGGGICSIYIYITRNKKITKRI